LSEMQEAPSSSDRNYKKPKEESCVFTNSAGQKLNVSYVKYIDKKGQTTVSISIDKDDLALLSAAFKAKKYGGQDELPNPATQKEWNDYWNQSQSVRNSGRVPERFKKEGDVDHNANITTFVDDLFAPSSSPSLSSKDLSK